MNAVLENLLEKCRLEGIEEGRKEAKEEDWKIGEEIGRAREIIRMSRKFNIADNEKLGTTKAILYAYRFGYLAKEPKISNPTNERYYNLIMRALESTEDTSVFSGAYSYIEGMLSVRKGGTYGKE